MQASPWLKKAPSTAQATAEGRSASSQTIRQFFPPSSIRVGVWLTAAAWMTARPAPGEPVKATFLTPGWVTRIRPCSGPPCTTDTTSSGSTSATSSQIRVGVIGVCSPGLSTTALPAARAGASLPPVWIGGQLKGMIAPTTPYGTSSVVSSENGVCRAWPCSATMAPAKKSNRPMQANTSPRAWSSGLPFSRVSIRAISSAWARRVSATAFSALARSAAGRAAQTGWAAATRATAAPISSPLCGRTQVISEPSAGSLTTNGSRSLWPAHRCW
ncbi:hypothetical protein Ssi03_02780 [Sphaerisporangium siamense]|uniref:Uncharacterized protein n=1 Tax=Sphaerisporangium siamense TaxID=795645 RepID=A0A7W7DC32_9ACTN|nr:hypothetical protein [Sphaerisporangium siamense]GII82288.1 hypothetical protein Ssi03_02780 [Sphaerisporangium siamense]